MALHRRRGINLNSEQALAYPSAFEKALMPRIVEAVVEPLASGTCPVCHKYIGRGLYNHEKKCKIERAGK